MEAHFTITEDILACVTVQVRQWHDHEGLTKGPHRTEHTLQRHHSNLSNTLPFVP